MGTLIINIEKEIVGAALTDAEEVELRVGGVSAEKEASFIPLCDGHLHLEGEVAKHGGLGIARLKEAFCGHV